jgi:hypothetical protein
MGFYFVYDFFCARLLFLGAWDVFALLWFALVLVCQRWTSSAWKDWDGNASILAFCIW